MNINPVDGDFTAEELQQAIALSLTLSGATNDDAAVIVEPAAAEKPTEKEREELRKKAEAESRLSLSLAEGFRAAQPVKDKTTSEDYQLFLKEPAILEAAFL